MSTLGETLDDYRRLMRRLEDFADEITRVRLERDSFVQKLARFDHCDNAPGPDGHVCCVESPCNDCQRVIVELFDLAECTAGGREKYRQLATGTPCLKVECRDASHDNKADPEGA